MMKKSILFISCDEAKHICDKIQYGEASSWEHFKLRLRLCYCKMAKRYSSKNNKLSETMQSANVNCLKTNERSKLQKQFDEELSKQQNN